MLACIRLFKPSSAFIFLLLGASSFIFESCATLSKSQLTAVNQFGKVAKAYSDYPSVVIKQRAKINWDSEQLLLNPYSKGTYNRDTTGYKRLIIAIINTHENYNKQVALEEKVDASLNVISQYAEALALLSSDHFAEDYQNEFTGFSDNLDSLIGLYNTKQPPGKHLPAFGSTVSQLLIAPGKLFIRHKQAKALRDYINKGKPLIDQITNTIINYMQGPLILQLESDQRLLAHNYNMYLIHVDSIQSSRTSPREFLESLQYFNRLQENIHTTRELSATIVAAAKELRKSHTSLAEAVNEKKNLSAHLATIGTFYGSYKTLKKLMASSHQSSSAPSTNRSL